MDINRHTGGAYQHQNKSPLRFDPNQKQHPHGQIQHVSSFDEEEEYNRRREEALRKQMQQSQQQLQQQQPPLRQKYDSFGQSDNYGSLERVPERERISASNHFTLGPQIKEEGTFETPPHIKEHIANIQNDNQSLMRRLNLVIQELERVKREKDDLINRLQFSSKEQTEVSRMLNNEDNVDKVNKYMQDDLAYERDRNHKIKQQIKELDLFKSELIRDLRQLHEEQDNLARDNQDETYTLQQKLSQIQDLEKEHYYTQEKISALNIAIDHSRAEFKENNGDKHELDRIITQLMQERNDLLSRLEHLTRKYDECVKEISQDRAEMESHNKQHAKLITAKIIFQLLETVSKNRIREGFQEFRTYCQFDSKCHQKLTQLSKLFQKIGSYKLRIALRTWFSNTLKPVQTKEQSKQLAATTSAISLKQKAFRLWRDTYEQRVNNYGNKTKAIEAIWSRYNRETQIETKRAFNIWKEVLSAFNLKKARVKKLIWSLYFRQLSQAMNVWVSHNSNLDLQVRLSLLTKDFSQKQYLTILFNNFRYQSYDQKRKRHNRLFHVMKAWKDHLAYQKFLMSTNLAALQFRRECNTSIAQACFDALKEHKESQKFERTHDTLNGEELPLIDQLTNDNENMVVDRKFKQKTQACESVKKMMSKQLGGYFMHWKAINEDYKEKLRTTVKDKIIKFYMESIRTAFTHWKLNHDENKIQMHGMVIEEMQQEQQNLQNDVLEMQKDINTKQEARDCSQKKSTLKCVLSYQKRYKQLAIGRWRDRVNELNVREDGASSIVRRLKLRFLRKAFDLYLAGVKYKKKLIVEEERCKLYNRTRDERLKKKVYNAWHLFRNNHSKAKDYWHRMFLKLDLTMKHAAVKRWKEQTQRLVETELYTNQSSAVDSIDQLNHTIGKMHQDETQQKQEIGQKKKQLTQQAQRIIANAFARYYYTNETRGFEKWKEFVQFQKKKERLMKKYLDHMMKYQFYYVKSCFKNWILNADIEERKEQVKKEEQKVKDATFQLEMQTKNHSDLSINLNEETDKAKEAQRVYNQRLQKSVQMITGKVHANHYTSQRRFIFQQWREYVRREVNFLNCIQNVIQKSLWSKGFQHIKEASRKQNKQDILETTLQKFRMKFWRSTCGNAFSVWRSGQYSTITSTIQEVEQSTQQVLEQHQQYVAKIKSVNANRATRLIAAHNLRNLFSSWKNVTSHLKQHRLKSSSCLQELQYFQMRNSLRKWRERKQTTKVARVRMARLKEKFYRIRTRFYFNALREQFDNSKLFCSRISNLANIHDLQGLKASFNAIRSFATAKSFVHQKRKDNSSYTLSQILESIVMRRKRMYLTDLKLKCLNKRKVEWIKGFTMMYNIGNQMRHFFNKWKVGSDKRTLAKEMYEEGPIREEAFEERIIFKNLKQLMSDEGYQEKEIADALQGEKSRQGHLLLKSVRRMQHFNQDSYLKPKVLDIWKDFVHQRRLLKFWLGFVQKRDQFIKSDLHNAFDKWKRYYPERVLALRKLSKMDLEKQTIKNNHKLEALADKVQDKENQLDHMNDQREALVDNYIKAQRLALSKWQNCYRSTLHQAFMRWLKKAKMIKNDISVSNLRKNLQFLDEIKNRVKQLEHDNDALANENEELRQFSLDGYQIAKNVQSLTSERESLSVDLADKAAMIRRLLDENEKLNAKLRYAQEEAQSMIKSTMAGSSGFKTGMSKFSKGFPSPMTRSTNYQ